MKNTLLFTILALFALTTEAAVESDSLTLYYHRSHTEIDTAYMGNGENLKRLADATRKGSDSLPAIVAIDVIGSASPEGTVAINRYLSKKRADRIFEYFSGYNSLPENSVSFSFIGRDWKGLKNLVINDPYVPFRDDVLTLIDDIINSNDRTGQDNENNLRKLKSLHAGKPYDYMLRHLFPYLRASRLYVTYNSVPPAIIPDDNITPPELTLTAVPIPVPETGYPGFPAGYQNCIHPFYMDVRSNMLSDILALPNIGVEFYIGKNWSVIADWTYGWWDIDRKHWYWRAYGGNIGFRKWFGRKADEKPLTGHHLGLSAGIITYDFECGGKGYMGGLPGKTLWDRCNYVASIEYGYSLPIARRFNIDFTIGIGYIGGKVIEYVPKNGNYLYQSTRRLNWVGPTKAEISLVWLIGCDNYNRKKGGRR